MQGHDGKGRKTEGTGEESIGKKRTLSEGSKEAEHFITRHNGQ